MSVQTSVVKSQMAYVRFEVLGKSHIMSPKEAVGMVRGLLETVDATSLLFSGILVCRSVVTESKNTEDDSPIIQEMDMQVAINHGMGIKEFKGSFTSEEFLRMMQYKSKISMGEWIAHIERFKKI